MSVAITESKTVACVRHHLTSDGTHVFYEYEGNFTPAKSNDFGDKLHKWFTTEHGNPLVSRFIARTYASTSDRWKNVGVETLNDETVALTANGVDENVVYARKVVFL